MRPTSHEVVLQGGTFVVPLTFATLQALGSVMLDPRPQPDPALGFVDPTVIVTNFTKGKSDPHPVVMARLLHAVFGSKSPGLEACYSLDLHRKLAIAIVEICARVVVALAPEQPQEPAKEADAPKP